jgi:hypothetical protein
MVMNPDRGFSDVEEDGPAWEVLERGWKSAMEFSDLEYRDLALRRILSDQSLLDKSIKNLMIIIKAVLCMRVITGAKTRTLAQTVQAAYQGFSFSCRYIFVSVPPMSISSSDGIDPASAAVGSVYIFKGPVKGFIKLLIGGALVTPSVGRLCSQVDI